MSRYIRKFLKYLSILLGLLLLVVVFMLFFTGPTLPANTNDEIESVIKADLPEMIIGETGFVISDNLRIWYESLPAIDSSKGTILLFMGISNDAMGWPPNFLSALRAGGYQVIRFDYRSTGMSDWVENYDERPFSLADMCMDAVAILDELNVEKAHIFGVSLGGMVAQEFVIHYPERSLSLTSLMSSGNIMDPDLPSISTKTLFQMVKSAIRYSINPNEKNTVKVHLATRHILKGEAEYDINTKEMAELVLYNTRQRKGYNPKASEQQQKATLKSGSRYEKLKSLDQPVFLIHGVNDPLIPIEHSKKLAIEIPEATTLWVENMGHDLPEIHMENVTNAILDFYSEKTANELDGRMVEMENGLKYQVLKKGRGTKAEKGDKLTIRETTSYKDGTLIFSTEQIGGSIQFTLGAKQVIEGLEKGLVGMKTGEQRYLIIPPSLSKRSHYPDYLSPDSTLYYVVDLLEIIKEK